MTTNTNNIQQTANNSFPVLGLLGILFVYLKLTGQIAWSWWYVTLPFWGPVVLVLAVVVVVAVVVGIFKLAEG